MDNLADILIEAEEITLNHIFHLKRNYLNYNSARKASNEASQRWRKIPINAVQIFGWLNNG